MKKSTKLNLITLVALFGISMSPIASYAKPTNDTTIKVKMLPAEGQKASGVIIFTQQKNGNILIVGDLKGLTPGEHGMHIHVSGDCEDSMHGFKTAGTHFNPTEVKHGSILNGHIGDLGNITADKKGNAKFKLTVSKFNLKDNDKLSILGRSIMVHANQDDEKTDPAGNSGDRILCGEITPKS